MTYRLRVIPKKKRRTTQAYATEVSYDLRSIERNLVRPLAKEPTRSDVAGPALAALSAISTQVTYPKEAMLFVEGQEPSGVFVLCEGRVKLSTNSADGKSFLVRVAERGELVGLPGAISGRTHELTAEALEPVQANFISRDAFLEYLREDGEAAVRVAEILSDIYHSTLREVRYLGFSSSTAEKLARFLLDLPVKPCNNNGYVSARLTLTHKEIGEMIGASRETVTRLLAHFKRRQLIEVQGSTLLITDKRMLAKLLEG